MREKIILTGSKGYIATALKPRIAGDYEIYPFDCNAPISEWKSQWHDFIQSIPKVKYICHFGADADANREDLSIFDKNYKATQYIVDYALSIDARLLFLSTCQAACPLGFYALSKRYAENYICQKMTAETAVILRLLNVFGGSGSRTGAKSIPQKIVDNELSHIFKECSRDFIHVTDVVTACLGFLSEEYWRSHANTPEIYDVGTAQAIYISDLVALTGKSLPTVDLPVKVPKRLVASKSKLAPTLKKHTISVIEWVKQYANI